MNCIIFLHVDESFLEESVRREWAIESVVATNIVPNGRQSYDDSIDTCLAINRSAYASFGILHIH